MRYAIPAVAAAAATLLVACSGSGGGSPDLRVMTQNMDEGTGYERLATAASPAEFVAAVSGTFNDIQATKPAERAKKIAAEIAARSPDLVGLQEASIVRTGTAPASHVESDLLKSLMDELVAVGMHYHVVTVADRLDAEAPSLSGSDVRLTSRDAILARDDAGLTLSNVRGGLFAAALPVPTAIGTIPIPRGWLAVDVHSSHGDFTFATTHLDTVAQVQLAQATELVRVLSGASLPVVLTGDFNSSADVAADPTHATHDIVVNAGYQDGTADTGPTCCQSPLLTNVQPVLTQRIDWIVVKGAHATSVERIGANPEDRTTSGLWPSDHAGVAASIQLGN